MLYMYVPLPGDLHKIFIIATHGRWWNQIRLVDPSQSDPGSNEWYTRSSQDVFFEGQPKGQSRIRPKSESRMQIIKCRIVRETRYIHNIIVFQYARRITNRQILSQIYLLSSSKMLHYRSSPSSFF